jgi:hypothetical protein
MGSSQPGRLACGDTRRGLPLAAARRRSPAAAAGGSSGWRAPTGGSSGTGPVTNLPDACINGRRHGSVCQDGTLVGRPVPHSRVTTSRPGDTRSDLGLFPMRPRRPGPVLQSYRQDRAGPVPARQGSCPANRTELEPGRWPRAGPVPATRREQPATRGRPPTGGAPAASNYRTPRGRGTFNQVTAGSQDEAPGRPADRGPRAAETSRPARSMPAGYGAGAAQVDQTNSVVSPCAAGHPGAKLV